ncbi:MAG: pitrilysin family protein [Clostridia bacterium]
MIVTKTMQNGIRVVTERMEHMRSAAIGVWVDTGSVRESAAESGASHFIEHMVFKGTKRRSAEQIAVETDGIGGNLNAFTSKECTCYYAKVLDEHLPLACDILSDILLHSTFDPAELKKEQGVILEEILMTEDSPEDLSAEESTMAFFGDDSLATPILGTRATVAAFTQESLFDYRDKHYLPKNIVVACAGHFDEQQLYSLIEEKFDMRYDEREAAPLTESYPGGCRTKLIQKDIEQVHINLTFPGFARDDDGQYPLAVLSNIIGGSMSSRLFQNIREKRGMAYSIYSYPSSYTTTGTFSLYAGTGDQQAEEVTRLMLEEIDRVRQSGVTKEELIRCREQLKGSYVLGMESTNAHMNAIGKVMLLQKREYNEAETLSRIECVTMQDIERIVPVCLNPKNLCAVFVGRIDQKRDRLEKLFG